MRVDNILQDHRVLVLSAKQALQEIAKGQIVAENRFRLFEDIGLDLLLDI